MINGLCKTRVMSKSASTHKTVVLLLEAEQLKLCTLNMTKQHAFGKYYFAASYFLYQDMGARKFYERFELNYILIESNFACNSTTTYYNTLYLKVTYLAQNETYAS